MDWEHAGKELSTAIDGGPFNVDGALELVVHVEAEGDDEHSSGDIPDSKLAQISPTFAAMQRSAMESGSVDFGMEEVMQINADVAAYRATLGTTATGFEPHEHMSATQKKVVALLTDEGGRVYSTLLAALRRYAAQFELPPLEEDEEDEEDERLAELFDDPSSFEDDEEDDEDFEEEDFESQFEIQRIHVYRNGEIGFVGHAEFEEEHGFGAIVWDGRVTEIGYADVADRT